MRLTCTVNGEAREIDGVWEGESLLYVLRERMQLPGSKNACEQGECGSCSVYLDDVLVCSCLVAAGQVEGRSVVTVEGLAGEDELHPIQAAFVEAGAVQCGFCTPGLIVATHDLLARNPSPNDAEIREALAGNLCRCTGYEKILDAVRLAASDDPRTLRRRDGRPATCSRTGTSSPRATGSRPSGPGATRAKATASTSPAASSRPGLINCHHHLYQWATRGLAQQATLFEWLVELYPVWARIDERVLRAAARAGLAALLRSGCTTASDHHYVFPAGQDLLRVEIEVARELGIRFHPCRGSMDLGASQGGLPPDSVVEDRDTIFAAYAAALDEFHDPSPGAMCRIALAPCSPFSVTQELMRDTAVFARERGVRLHTHMAETVEEEAFCIERFGMRPVEYLEDLGWLGDDVWLAHCVHLSDREIARFGGDRGRAWRTVPPRTPGSARGWRR